MRFRSLILTGVVFASVPFLRPVEMVNAQLAQRLTSSNWPMFHYSPNHIGVNPVDTAINRTNVGRLTVKWKALTGDKVVSSPAVADGKVFVGSDDRKVYAFDADTGAVKWTVSTGRMVRSAPAYDNGTVFVGSVDSKLYAINASSGAIKWKRTTEGSISYHPTVTNGTVYVGTKTGTLYAINETTGAVKWTAHPNYANTWSSPAVSGGVVYMGWDDSKLYALNASTGVTKWSTTLGGKVRCAPSVANGVVYVGADNGLVYALNAATGHILWSARTEDKSTKPYVRSSPAVANGLVYVASAANIPMGGHLYAFNAVTGAVVWSAVLQDYSVSSPAVANGIVYVGAARVLAAFDALNGTKYWTSGDSTMKGNVQQSDPAVGEGMVLQSSWDHYLYAFGIVPGQLVGAIVQVSDTGLLPDVVSGFDFGRQVEFDFLGPSTHSVIDSNGLGLINSGPREAGATYLATFPGAGRYEYKDGYSSAHGTVKVPMDITPTSGSIHTTFTVTWAAGPPPAGFVYDIQIKRPGSPRFVNWKLNQTVPSVTYVPTAGTGTYAFHARVTNSSTGTHTMWCLGFSIKVA